MASNICGAAASVLTASWPTRCQTMAVLLGKPKFFIEHVKIRDGGKIWEKTARNEGLQLEKSLNYIVEFRSSYV